MKSLLFFPAYLGGGFGHIAACLALAEEWRKRGGRAVFLLGGPHVGRVRQAGFEAHIFRSLPVRPSRGATPAYTRVNDLRYLAVRDGLDHPLRVEAALWEAGRVIGTLRPDALVGDGFLLTGLLGRQFGLPVIQIAKSVFHPQAVPLGAWEISDPGQILPDPRGVFAPVFARRGWRFDGMADLIGGELYLLRGIPALDPLEPLPARTCYIGALTRPPAPAGKAAPAWAAWRDSALPLVYVTIGGASHSGVSVDLFKLLVRAFAGQPYQALLSTGGRADLLEDLPANVRAETWLDPSDVLQQSAAVVHHGGYTRMDALAFGLPSVVIPFQTEQEYYGRILQGLGAAKRLAYSEAPYTRITAHWRGGHLRRVQPFTLDVRPHPTLRPEDLRAAVEQALQDGGMRQAALNLRDALRAYSGVARAADLIAENVVAPG